jgi:hypothetical protein
MANVIELEQWEDGVYRLETTDPIVGGESGVDNLPHKLLANRTKYLKAQLDALYALQIRDSKYATLAEADAAAVLAGAPLMISQTWAVVPATLNAKIIDMQGGQLNATGNVAIAGLFRGADGCFGANQTATLLQYAYPDWFTVNTTPGTTDMAAAIQKALNASKYVVGKRYTVYGISAGSNIPTGVLVDWNNATLRRIPGTLNAGPTTYMLKANAVTGVKVKNLLLDGNKAANSLVAETLAHRFGGLVFEGCSDCYAEDIDVTGTVNAEDTAGIYVLNCTEVHLSKIKGYSNDKTAVLFWTSDRCTLNGALFYTNLGSGVSSYDSDTCKYLDITAHDNGYSQVSVNGVNCVVDNIVAYNGAAGYAGVNLGHDAASNRADYCQASNITTYNNAGWGLTVVGSTGVAMTNIMSYGNTQQNVRIFNGSTKCKLNNVTAFDGTSYGVIIESGTNHQLNNIEAYGNGLTGLQIQTGVNGCQLANIKVYNNGTVTSANSGGLIVNSCSNTLFSNVEAYDDQGVPTQESGVWIAGGSGHVVNNIYTHNNKTYNYRETSSPTDITYKGLRTGTNALQGVFTAANNTATTVSNNNARTTRIKVWPTNAAAVAKGLPFISSVSVGVSFTATFSSTLAGTETYAYEME